MKDYNGLPGRIVGLSFSIVATRYYLNIFSSISTRSIDKFVDYFIRFNAFCFSLPVFWALLVNPKDWPICSAIGVLLVALNNQFCLNLAKKAKKEITPSSSIRAFLDTFKNWPYLMFIYSGGLVAISVLFHINYAKDEMIYALTVAIFINLFNMYYTNSTKDAPTIRGGLERLFIGLERAEMLKPLKKNLLNGQKE
jgi:hypothetical protein